VPRNEARGFRGTYVECVDIPRPETCGWPCAEEECCIYAQDDRKSGGTSRIRMRGPKTRFYDHPERKYNILLQHMANHMFNGDRDLVPCLIALSKIRLQKLELMFTSPPRFIPWHICRVPERKYNILLQHMANHMFQV
jgi:hypothetical protein